jgi:hypothetical protein
LLRRRNGNFHFGQPAMCDKGLLVDDRTVEQAMAEC